MRPRRQILVYTRRVKTLKRPRRGSGALLDESGGMKLSRSGIVIRRRIDLEGILLSIRSTKCNGRATRPAARAIADVDCILIIGDTSQVGESEQEIEIKARTFELFRRNLRSAEVFTYNELLERARYMVGGGQDDV